MESTRSGEIAIVFLDLQQHVVPGVKTVGRHKLRRAASALAKLAALHGVPTFLSAIPDGGDYVAGIVEALRDPVVRERTFTTAFGDTQFVADLAACGRKTLILAGVASEIVVLRTAIDALAADYDVQIAIDACGGFSERTEAAAWNRATTHGALMTSVVTLAAELAGDFTTELGAATLAILHEAAGG
ncbi:MAG: isochorismatase family protein [Burkholderiaceae bacterium]